MEGHVVRFVFTSGCLWKATYLACVVCVCLRVLMSRTCGVVFFVCFSLSCVPYVASLSVLSFFDCPFGIL